MVYSVDGARNSSTTTPAAHDDAGIFQVNIHQQLEKFLRDLNVSSADLFSSLQTTVVVPADPGDKGGLASISWGLIIPIVLIGLFLVCVGACLYWHSWRGKRRLDTSMDGSPSVAAGASTAPNLSLSRFLNHSTASREDWSKEFRSSSRSGTPLRVGSFRDKARVQPQQMTYTESETASLSSYSQSTMSGTCSSMHDVYTASIPRRNLSPIDEMETSKTPASSPVSYGHDYTPPTMQIDAQAPFSPYHLTWVTPQTSRTTNSADLTGRKSFQRPNTTRTTSENSYCGYSMAGYPYYPPHNTPTTDNEAHYEQVSLQHINVGVTTDPQAGPVIGSIGSQRSRNMPRHEFHHDISASVSSNTGYPESFPVSSRHCSAVLTSSMYPSENASHNASESISLPSSISHWHSSNVCHHDPVGLTLPRNSRGIPLSSKSFSHGLASSIESYTSSENVSMLPNVGSSTNASGLPFSGPSTNTDSVEYSRRSADAVTHTAQAVGISISKADRSACLLHGNQIAGESLPPAGLTTYSSDLLRSWSVTAELNYISDEQVVVTGRPASAIQLAGSSSSTSEITSSRSREHSYNWENFPEQAPRHHSGNIHTAHSDTELVAMFDPSHNNLNKQPPSARGPRTSRSQFVFQNIPAPILESKKYWL